MTGTIEKNVRLSIGENPDAGKLAGPAMMGEMNTRGLILAAVFLAAAGLATAAQEAGQVWLSRVGDDPAWAAPDLDESDWRRSDGPEPLTLRRYPCRGWYRLHFTLPAARPEGGWGVVLGRIQTADEVFLNGVFIGGEGVIADRFVDALYKTRVYALPGGLLRSGGNVLAIRVQSSLDRGGLLNVPAVFGDLGALRAATERRAARRKQLEAFFLGMLSVALAFWLVLLVYGVRQSEYLYFGALVGLLAMTFLLESLLWYDAGLATPHTQRLCISLFLLLPLPLLLFGARLVQGVRRARAHKLLAACCAVLSLACLLGGTLRVVRVAELWWWFILLALGILLLQQAWRLRAWRLSAAPLAVAVGLALFGLFALLEQGLPSRMLTAVPFGLFLHAGFASLAASLACALAVRFHHANERLRTLSRQLLVVQEDACKRTASALHNELAPTLAAVKLDLQIFLSKHALTAEGRRVVEQLAAAIDQARTLSREMHPVAVDHLGLPAALRALAGRLAEVNGWTLRLDLPDAPGLTGPHAALLYRMGQELLYNVAKHAEAHHVEVSLAVGEDGARLAVRDDGKGCDPGTTPPGIGWISLRERAETLGGRCRIMPRKEGGLEVTLWIPPR